MAHNSYVRPSGVWNPNQVVTHGELAALDLGQFRSINGDDGGTWAPASPITIGGAGVTLRLVNVSTVTNGGQLTFASGAAINLDASSLASFLGEAAFGPGSFTGIQDGGNFHFYAGSAIDMEEGAQASFYGQLTVKPTGVFTSQGNAVFSGAVTEVTGAAVFTAVCQFATTTTVFFQGTTNHTGGAAFSGALTIAGPTSLTGTVTTSGAGRVVKRTAYIAGTGGSFTGYGPVNCDRVLVEGLTADSILTIDNTGVQEGDEIEVTNLSGDYFLRVSGSSVFGILKNSPGNLRSVKGIYISGHWRFFSGSNY